MYLKRLLKIFIIKVLILLYLGIGFPTLTLAQQANHNYASASTTYLSVGDFSAKLDSIRTNKGNVDKVSFWRKPVARITFAPSLFLVASAGTWSSRENIREIRNRYLPEFRNKYDDYLQYVPAVATYTLKLSGVKGRNSLARNFYSHATSLVIMGVIVNGIKYTSKVERPDGSANNSFPSGHSAMAFTNATMMHKEYGVVHPLYSIAAYSAASFTSVGRSLNNKHWLPDILAGAGIGILSTQLGYFIVDKFYKNNGDNMSILSRMVTGDTPSYLAGKIGYTDLLGSSSHFGATANMGFEAGVEGAYYWNSHWGVGGDFSFASFPLSRPKIMIDKFPALASVDFDTEAVGFLNFGFGPFYSFELDKRERWLLQFKLTAGMAFGTIGKVTAEFEDTKSLPLDEKYLVISTYKPHSTFRGTGGVTLSYKIKDDLGVSTYFDYNYLRPTIRIRVNELDRENLKIPAGDTATTKRMDYLAAGLKLTAFF